MFRKIQIMGNVGGDPDIRDIASGDKAGNFRVCCNETWKGANGEKQSRAHWFTVTAFQKGPTGIISSVFPLIKKGDPIFIDGSPSMRDWTDQAGQKRTAFEIRIGPNDTIRLLGNRNHDGAKAPDPEQPPGAGPAPAENRGMTRVYAPNLDDDIPF